MKKENPMRKANLYMATVAFFVTSIAWAAYQGPPNYPVLNRYTGVNPYQDAATMQFENFYQPTGCAFDVYTREDPNSCVVDVNIPGYTTVRGGTISDPNETGYLTEYRFDFVPPDPNLHNVDVLTTGSTCRPQIRLGKGLVMTPRLDPNYDYALAMVDPREYQKAVKATHRYQFLNGLPILYGNILELIQGKVEKP